MAEVDGLNLLGIETERHALNTRVPAAAFADTVIRRDAWVTAVDSIPRILKNTRPRVYSKTTHTAGLLCVLTSRIPARP